MSLRDPSNQEPAGGGGESGRLDFSGAHEEPGVWLPRLQRLLADQLGLAQQIELIDGRKSAALADNDMEAYLGLLDQRGVLVERLMALNEELKPFAERFALLATGLKEEQRASVYAEARKLDAVLAEITRRDAAEAEMLAARRDKIAQELSDVRTGSNALGAYGKRQTPPPPQSHDQDA
ncbi:MAG: hypothetical protein QM783_14640 [Phycisphaerales bacterium]